MRDEDRAVAAKFDRLAREGFMAEFTPDERARLEAHLQRWALTPGHRILEPGCGTGRLTEVLAGLAGPGGEVVAFDISAEMVALARQRFQGRERSRLRPGAGIPRGRDGCDPDCHGAPVSFEVGDGRNLDRPDGYFDRIVCFQVFPHIVRRDEVLREFRRVLKPDGVLWIAHLIGRERVNEIHRRSSPPLNTHLLPDEAELQAILAAAGFAPGEVEDDENGFSFRAAVSPPA